MNKKVSLRELVIAETIFTFIIALIYWLWARTDWNESYTTIQNTIFLFLFVFFATLTVRCKKYNQEEIDELARQNLKRCDSICYKLMTLFMLIITSIAAIVGHTKALGTSTIGWMIIITIIVISIIRTILFIVMDKKGI